MLTRKARGTRWRVGDLVVLKSKFIKIFLDVEKIKKFMFLLTVLSVKPLTKK